MALGYFDKIHAKERLEKTSIPYISSSGIHGSDIAKRMQIHMDNTNCFSYNSFEEFNEAIDFVEDIYEHNPELAGRLVDYAPLMIKKVGCGNLRKYFPFDWFVGEYANRFVNSACSVFDKFGPDAPREVLEGLICMANNVDWKFSEYASGRIMPLLGEVGVENLTKIENISTHCIDTKERIKMFNRIIDIGYLLSSNNGGDDIRYFYGRTEECFSENHLRGRFFLSLIQNNYKLFENGNCRDLLDRFYVSSSIGKLESFMELPVELSEKHPDLFKALDFSILNTVSEYRELLKNSDPILYDGLTMDAEIQNIKRIVSLGGKDAVELVYSMGVSTLTNFDDTTSSGHFVYEDDSICSPGNKDVLTALQLCAEYGNEDMAIAIVANGKVVEDLLGKDTFYKLLPSKENAKKYFADKDILASYRELMSSIIGNFSFFKSHALDRGFDEDFMAELYRNVIEKIPRIGIKYFDKTGEHINSLSLEKEHFLMLIDIIKGIDDTIDILENTGTDSRLDEFYQSIINISQLNTAPENIANFNFASEYLNILLKFVENDLGELAYACSRDSNPIKSFFEDHIDNRDVITKSRDLWLDLSKGSTPFFIDKLIRNTDDLFPDENNFDHYERMVSLIKNYKIHTLSSYSGSYFVEHMISAMQTLTDGQIDQLSGFYMSLDSELEEVFTSTCNNLISSAGYDDSIAFYRYVTGLDNSISRIFIKNSSILFENSDLDGIKIIAEKLKGSYPMVIQSVIDDIARNDTSIFNIPNNDKIFQVAIELANDIGESSIRYYPDDSGAQSKLITGWISNFTKIYSDLGEDGIEVLASRYKKSFTEKSLFGNPVDVSISLIDGKTADYEKFKEEFMTAAYFEEARSTFSRYCTGLLGRRIKIISGDDSTTNGLEITIPHRINIWETKEKNKTSYQVTLTHEVGHLKHGSFDFVLDKVSETVKKINERFNEAEEGSNV